jgi:hypothetical protein
MTPQQAETIALNMLTFLVSDRARAEAFLRVTGLEPADLRRGAGDAGFLAGVADYVLGDERLLVAFAADQGLAPDSLRQVRRALPGGDGDF